MTDAVDFKSAYATVPLIPYDSRGSVLNFLGCVHCSSAPFGGTLTSSNATMSYYFFVPDGYVILGGKFILRVNAMQADPTVCDSPLVSKPDSLTATLNGKSITSLINGPIVPAQDINSEIHVENFPTQYLIKGKNTMVFTAGTSCPTNNIDLAGSLMPVILIYVAFNGNL